jgi:hypothetical protein
VKKLKHDVYLEALCDDIKSNYDKVLTNVPVYSSNTKNKKKRRVIAEIDILALKDNFCDIYEVKCSKRRIKARRQLTKIKKLLPDANINNMFFFCGESGSLEQII